MDFNLDKISDVKGMLYIALLIGALHSITALQLIQLEWPNIRFAIYVWYRVHFT
jgi:hypothetical protein